jgi:hypothetical protein
MALEFPAFAADGKKDIAMFMERIVKKFDANLRIAVEQLGIQGAYLVPTACNSAQRIIHAGFIGLQPYAGHTLEIALIEGCIELIQGTERSALRIAAVSVDRN